MKIHVYLCILSVLLAGAAGIGPARAHAQPDRPETVMITLHAKPGADSDLARAIASHWTTARRLNLVVDAPHLTLRSPNGKEFVEILTWRDENIPDDAPPEIRAIWDEMNRLVEPRGGAQGLTISRMTVVGDKP